MFLRIWKYIMYDISEQYADEIVTYHFLVITSDLIYDKCYSFHRKTTFFCFAFALIIVNLIVFDQLRSWPLDTSIHLRYLLGTLFRNYWESPKTWIDMNHFKIWLGSLYQFEGNLYLISKILLKYSFCWLSSFKGV